jgi:hypothetical protein
MAMPAEPVDLKIELRCAAGAYTAEVDLDQGGDTPRASGPFSVPLNLDRLRAISGDAPLYGSELAGMLFADSRLLAVLFEARGYSNGRGVPLRIRLAINDSAAELQGLRWELLRLPVWGPGSDQPLCTREDILFSRFLPAGADSGLARPQAGLRALAAIAAPENAAALNFSPIVVEDEVARARSGLAGMVPDWLGAPGSERCTMPRLAERIPNHDVLYLVCHGKVIDNQGYLLLVNEDKSADRVKAANLVQRLYGRLNLPRLAILVVCESAGVAGPGTLGAIAPRLVEAGIPAVVAMQGSLTFPTADLFLPPLFQALNQSGVIDQAVAAARRAILGQADESAPVLFMGLKSGRLWAGGSSVAAGAASAPSAGATSLTPPQVAAVAAGRAGDLFSDESPPPWLASADGKIDQVALYTLLSGPRISPEDLQDLCFTLQVDWDNLPGGPKSAKARAMIQYFNARGRLGELVAALRAQRPDLGL